MMEPPRRFPLHDLPLDQFLSGNKPRLHKRPLSPTTLNPAKRRVLDAQVVANPVPSAPSSTGTLTPTRPSRLGIGLARNQGHRQETSFPLSHPHSSSRELYPQPTVESSIDPQSRHYPGFDIFRDIQHRRGSPAPRAYFSCDGNARADGCEEDKENVPLGRRSKKLVSKKRHLSGLDSPAAPCLCTPTSTTKVARPERTPLSAHRALR